MSSLKLNNVKTEVAIEIISLYICLALKDDKELVQRLIDEREKIYLGDKYIVDKIINEYGRKINSLLSWRK